MESQTAKIATVDDGAYSRAASCRFYRRLGHQQDDSFASNPLEVERQRSHSIQSLLTALPLLLERVSLFTSSLASSELVFYIHDPCSSTTSSVLSIPGI